jgi:hypothetical protein
MGALRVALAGAIGVGLCMSALASDSDLLGGAITTVPEPSTLIAGALLLLPFGASMIQVLRRKRD